MSMLYSNGDGCCRLGVVCSMVDESKFRTYNAVTPYENNLICTVERLLMKIVQLKLAD